MKTETFEAADGIAPDTISSPVRRTREYLTGREIERLMATARKHSRYGHRDATMILIGYRHGLRASELCDLQWHQVELATGRLHVRRRKGGSASVHPLQGGEIRALRRLQREQGASSHVFGARWTDDAQGVPCPVRPDRRASQDALSCPSAYAAPRVRLCPGQSRPRYAGAPGLAWAQEHPAHRSVYRASAGPVQELLAGLT
jgi:integrase